MTRKEKRLKRIEKTKSKKLRRWFYRTLPKNINIEEWNKKNKGSYYFDIFGNTDIKRSEKATELLEKIIDGVISKETLHKTILLDGRKEKKEW